MSNNIYGIDFGTCNFKVFSKSSGKVISEKNTIAIINKTQIYAYGDDAYAMYEKAPESINVTFPVSTGVIADYNFLQTMIFDYIEKKLKGRVKNAEFLVAVPTDITDVEKRAFFELFYKSKFRPKNVMLCEKPLADAVGLGIDVNQPTGVMVVDMGADTIEISVISLGGLVLSDLMHFGSNRLDESIISYIRREFNLVIGKKTEITAEVVYEAIKANLESICSSIKLILEKTPPELARDIIYAGIYITGGGSKIKDLDQLFTQITNIKVNTCENPEESAVRGLSKIATDSKYKRIPFSMKNTTLK